MKDKEVGWCEVGCDTGDAYFFPRIQFEQLSTKVEEQKGWFAAIDVYGAEQKFRLRDVNRLTNESPESIAAKDKEAEEHRYLDGEE